MQDTFQNSDTMQEFLSSDYYKQALEQFKASKAPKKEWEIVAYCFEPLKGIDKPVLVKEGDKYWEKAKSGDKDFPIHSVRRLSDGEFFSVGDRINGGIIQRIDTTTSSMDGIMFRTANVSKPISCAEKIPQPILTTVDGKEVYDWKDFHPAIVFPDFDIKANASEDYWIEAKAGYPESKLFSTRSAAEEYILNHRPLLSLNDVKEWVEVAKRSNLSMDFILEKAEHTVKQKLNPRPR